MYNHENKEFSDSLTFPSSFLKKEKTLLEEDREIFINNLLKVAPERVHTAMPGLIILNTLSKYFKCEKIIVSNYGVREGVLTDYLKEDTGRYE